MRLYLNKNRAEKKREINWSVTSESAVIYHITLRFLPKNKNKSQNKAIDKFFNTLAHIAMAHTHTQYFPCQISKATLYYSVNTKSTSNIVRKQEATLQKQFIKITDSDFALKNAFQKQFSFFFLPLSLHLSPNASETKAK